MSRTVLNAQNVRAGIELVNELVSIPVNQPSLAPTPKVASTGFVGVLILPAVVAGLTALAPEVSAACVREVGVAWTAVGLSVGQGIITTAVAYFKRDKRTLVLPQ